MGPRGWPAISTDCGRAEGVTKSRTIPIVLAVAAVVLGWIFANPNAKFGLSRFGVTTYSRIPIPPADVQVRQDGAIRLAWKSHDIDPERLAWLVSSPAPEVLVVAVGWEETAHLSDSFRPPRGMRVVVLRTPDALAFFNSLRDQGVRAAIYIHSTC
jgi:hypothetical protein